MIGADLTSEHEWHSIHLYSGNILSAGEVGFRWDHNPSEIRTLIRCAGFESFIDWCK